MTWKNTADRWGGVSQLLHWLVVLLILGQGAAGLWMVDMLNSPDKIRIYALHKSFGLTILALALLRLGWRLYAGAPRPLTGVPGWQRNAARLSHWLLYALLFAIPLSGWLFNSAAGFPLQWFGLFNLPAIAARDAELRDLAASAHEWLFWLLVAVALVHAAAAFHHHLFLQDATLARMLPRGWLRAGPGSPTTLAEDSRDA
ncbi:cytochrome b [Luteimonas sp. RD2P54]|uniref:Cytochrome b n=1 Tax=Luteimonas endophytica TaxID=3042023 RepID=A0ABT6JAB1_9GAMM|nr:cytochrome b [Luteimonas endophytica]MDH5823522.1 cytochrome b [Luteimonas endophytica]